MNIHKYIYTYSFLFVQDIQLEDLSRPELLKIYLSVTADFSRIKKRSKSTGSDNDDNKIHSSYKYSDNYMNNNDNGDDIKYDKYYNKDDDNYKNNIKNRYNYNANDSNKSHKYSLRYHSSFHKYKNESLQNSKIFNENENLYNDDNMKNKTTGSPYKSNIYYDEKKKVNINYHDDNNEDDDYHIDEIKKRKEKKINNMRVKKKVPYIIY